MTITDRSTSVRLVDADPQLLGAPATVPPIAPADPSAASSEILTCSQTLPRDLLVRLTALSHQVGSILRGRTADAELSLRLETIGAGLDALIRSVYDETAQHIIGAASSRPPV